MAVELLGNNTAIVLCLYLNFSIKRASLLYFQTFAIKQRHRTAAIAAAAITGYRRHTCAFATSIARSLLCNQVRSPNVPTLANQAGQC